VAVADRRSRSSPLSLADGGRVRIRGHDVVRQVDAMRKGIACRSVLVGLIK